MTLRLKPDTFSVYVLCAKYQFLWLSMKQATDNWRAEVYLQHFVGYQSIYNVIFCQFSRFGRLRV